MGVTSWVFYARVGFLSCCTDWSVYFFLKKTKLKISVGTVAVDRFQSTILLDNFNQADRRVPCVNEQRRRLLVELIYKWSKESY